jgi:hypothetical protein
MNINRGDGIKKSFFERVVEAAKFQLRKMKFMKPMEEEIQTAQIVNRVSRKLRREYLRGNQLENRKRRSRAHNRLAKESRRINFARARAR